MFGSRRNFLACTEINGRDALAGAVVPPTPDDAIDSECHREIFTSNDASASPEVGGNSALAVVVFSPASDVSIDSECDGVVDPCRDA